MTNNNPTNLEIIKQACIKANPEIMELGVGQKIQHKNNPYPHIIIASTVAGSFYSCYYRSGDIDLIKWLDLEGGVKVGEYKILGREITLADVLLALISNFKLCKDCNGGGSILGNNLGVSECNSCGGDGHNYGDIELPTEFYTAGSRFNDFRDRVLDLWDLTKPLEGQSEETLNFLAQLLHE